MDHLAKSPPARSPKYVPARSPKSERVHASSSRNTMPKKGVAAGKGVWSRMNEPIEAPAFLDRSDPNYDSETEDFYLEEIYLGMGSLDDMLAHKQDVAKSPSPRGASHMPSPDPNDF